MAHGAGCSRSCGRQLWRLSLSSSGALGNIEHEGPQQNDWSESGRATSIANSEALGRPHRSVPSLDAMLPSPENIASLDPDEFMGALQYANMVAGYEFLEEIPAIGKPIFKTDEGTVALTNIPENRFGLAIAKHFRKQQDKTQSFMWRWWALQKVRKHKSMRKYIRGAGDELEIHCAVFEVAATHKLSDKYEFRPKPFFEEVRRVAALMDAEEAPDI